MLPRPVGTVKEVQTLKAIVLGLTASFFFACTFVLNRSMSLGGGSWIWSASLRYLFMLPMLLALVWHRKNLGDLFQEMKRSPTQWMVWSIVGFGFFYIPLCISAAYSPAWLVAGTWQFTIIGGSLIVPLFWETIHTPTGVRSVRKKIPWKGLTMSILIVIGIVIMEGRQAEQVSLSTLLLGMVPVLIGAFAYPLGNRKMMEVCGARVDTFQRVLGMTLASLPLWILLSVVGLFTTGAPSSSQVGQSLIVAIFSGVVATVLFFKATDLTRGNVQQLATVEATQAAEVVFALILELVILPGTLVRLSDVLGMLLVVAGIILHSFTEHVRGSQSKGSQSQVNQSQTRKGEVNI